MNDAFAVEASNRASILCCLLLAAVEVGWHCHHTLSDCPTAKSPFGKLFHFLQHDCRDFLWVERWAAVVVESYTASVEVVSDHRKGPRLSQPGDVWVVKLPPNQPLDVVRDVGLVVERLLAGCLPDGASVCLVGDVRWELTPTLLSFDFLQDLNSALLCQVANAAVRCAKINAYDWLILVIYVCIFPYIPLKQVNFSRTNHL